VLATSCAVLSVSLVVSGVNEERHIGRLLAGVQRQRLQPKQVILVDSGSTDATVSIARQLASLSSLAGISVTAKPTRYLPACFAAFHPRRVWLAPNTDPKPGETIGYGDPRPPAS
jgi:hypothetical protein